MAIFKAINAFDKEIVELAKNLSTVHELWEHDLELGDGRVVRLMNVEWNGQEVWSVFADAGKGELVIEETKESRMVNGEIWTVEDEATYAPLRKKKLRIEAKARRDKTRVRRFSHKSRKQ